MKPHTLEELNELNEWFETHNIPQSLHLDKYTYFPELKEAIKALIEQAYVCYENPKMQGGIILLEKIKAALEKV